MARRVRNRGCLPYLASEGVILKPIPIQADFTRGGNWYRGLRPFQRMHSHQTLGSVRRYAHFKPFSGLIPEDSLDFLLAATYNHGEEVFQDKEDLCLQKETLGLPTWRVLRNYRDIKVARTSKEIEALTGHVTMGTAGARGEQHQPKGGKKSTEEQERYNPCHPVLIGGITERRHPSNVKLMNSSHHSPQTNAGYTRQDRDGTRYQY